MSDHREQFVLSPFLGCGRRDQLLRQNIKRRRRHLQLIEVAAPDGFDQRRTLDQFVPSRREQPTLGYRAHPVARAADALKRDSDRARRTDLAGEIDGTDVDTQLERCRRHDDSCLSGLRVVRRRAEVATTNFRGEPQRLQRPDVFFSRSSRLCETRSTSLRVLTKTNVDRC